MKAGNYVILRLYRGYKLFIIVNIKLFVQLIKFFKIIERIGKLAYRLQLLKYYRIHDIINIAYFEFILNPAGDLYNRRFLLSSPVTIGTNNEYEIDRLLIKRRIRKGRE